MNTSSPSIQTRPGFALILALGLMSLVLLLLVSFSALIQVENVAAEQQRNSVVARQYALIGAYQALGVLQQEAGPDARVTARADIISSNNDLQNPYWTGVWNTSGNEYRWLVSMQTSGGSSPTSLEPTQTIVDNRVEIFPRTNGPLPPYNNAVTVQGININTGDQQSGVYAWWVCDEGVKASIAARRNPELENSNTINDVANVDRQKSRSLYPQRLGLETWIDSDPDNFILPTEDIDLLGKINSPKQLSLIESGDFSLVLSDNSHDLTLVSYGVLAHTLPNTQRSLKMDLSTELNTSGTSDYWTFNSQTALWEPTNMAAGSLLPSGWQNWAAPLSAFLNAWRAEDCTAFTSRAPSIATIKGSPSPPPRRLPLVGPIYGSGSPQQGDPVFSTMPVLSEFSIHYAPFSRSENLRTDSYSGAYVAALLALGDPVGVYYRANQSVLEDIGRDEPGREIVPHRMRFRNSAWFELWNPYTAQVVYPRSSSASSAPVLGYLRAEVTGLPVFRATYWYDASGSGGTGNSVYFQINRFFESTLGLDGFSDNMDMQSIMGYNRPNGGPMCVNLPIPHSTTFDGGAIQSWLGLTPALNTGNRIMTAAWGFKEGLVCAKSGGNWREDGRVHNLFAALPFRFGNTDASFSTAISKVPLVPPDRVDTNKFPTANQAQGRSAFLQMEHVGTPRHEIRLAWVTSASAGSNSGTLISTYSMPEPPDLGYGSQWANFSGRIGYPSVDGQLNDPYRLETLVSRFGYFFLRNDSSADLDWLTKPDPRSISQDQDQFIWPREIAAPEDVHAYLGEATTFLKEYLLESPAATTRPRSAAGRDQMNPVSFQNDPNPVIHEDFIDYQTNPDGRFNDVFPQSSDRRPLEDLSTKVPLFEIPTSAPVSLGVLQHLSIEGVRPFSVGNSWGASVSVGSLNANAVFDVFTLTALDTVTLSQITEPGKSLRNPHLQPLWNSVATAPSVSATAPLEAHFLTKGAFNINSTSTLAWAAFLSNIFMSDGSNNESIEDWRYYARDEQTSLAAADNTATASQKLRRAFFRFPHTAEYSFVAPTPSRATNTNRLLLHKNDTTIYRKGVRTVSIEQINTMAEHIVEQLRLRGRPFYSMQEFLSPASNNESVLESAIRTASVNNRNDPRWDVEGTAENGPDPLSSAYLTQADMLNTLAPLMQARSDTFKIRGYGEVRLSSGEIGGKAVCELMVQRYPETADKDDPGGITNPSTADNALGRKFKIISLKWINES